MSIHAGAIINAIPHIEQKTYCELGLGIAGPIPLRAQMPNGMPVHLLDAAHGSTWIQVRAKRKYGVDTVWGPFVTHCMTTSEFFALPDLPKFDVIFIDANHMWEAVLEDWNNSVAHLAPRGIILAHDLVPPDAEHADNPGKCGDGYKVLWSVDAAGIKYWTCDEDMGLTVFPGPHQTMTPAQVENRTLGYPEFMGVMGPRRIPLTELLRRVAGL